MRLTVEKGTVMQSNRCRHYHLEMALIPVPGTPILLRVPIRRCVLAERMIVHLSSVAHGQETARKLMFVSSPTGDTHIAPAPDVLLDTAAIRAVFGPDLEPIHHLDCLAQRCLESCTPGYKSLLEQFGLTAEADQENGRGCLEETSLPEELKVEMKAETKEEVKEDAL